MEAQALQQDLIFDSVEIKLQGNAINFHFFVRLFGF